MRALVAVTTVALALVVGACGGGDDDGGSTAAGVQAPEARKAAASVGEGEGRVNLIARAGYVDSVGDGLFRKKHSHDERAAAFWFMAVAPITVMAGYAGERASQAGDRRALIASGVATTLIIGLSASMFTSIVVTRVITTYFIHGRNAQTVSV